MSGEGRAGGTTGVTFEITASGPSTDRLRLRARDKDGEPVHDDRPSGRAPAVDGVVRVGDRG